MERSAIGIHWNSNRLLADLFFRIHFRVLMCAIRMLLKILLLQMTDNKASKFTRSMFIKKPAIYYVKKPGR